MNLMQKLRVTWTSEEDSLVSSAIFTDCCLLLQLSCHLKGHYHENMTF